ncbi:t-SNARE [Gorgonomyces haynaldii]|nr:t-SNARE [Gorgonomyces haynaldii]
MNKITGDLSVLEQKLRQLTDTHERALVAFGSEQQQCQQLLDALADEIGRQLIDLKQLVRNLDVGDGRDRQAKQQQQQQQARRLMDFGVKFQKTQNQFKQKYQEKIKREVRIVKPDATEQEVQQAIQTGNVFAQQITGRQQKELEQVQARHLEIRKIEESVEQLALLFQDMQELLNTQEQQINVINTQVDDVVVQLEQGGKEIQKATQIRENTRKNMRYLVVGGVILVLIIALVVYFMTKKKN